MTHNLDLSDLFIVLPLLPVTDNQNRSIVANCFNLHSPSQIIPETSGPAVAVGVPVVHLLPHNVGYQVLAPWKLTDKLGISTIDHPE